MKIYKLSTGLHVNAGSPKAEGFFTREAHSLHKGLKMEPYVHPELGPGVMIETDALRAKGQVSFVSINNIKEIVFENEKPAAESKSAKK